VTIFFDGYIPNQIKEKGEGQKELERLLQKLQEDPDDSLLLLCVGEAFYERGQYRKAKEYFRKAYNNRNINLEIIASIYLNYAICLMELGEFEAALIILLEGQEQYPQYTDLWYLSGFSCYKMGRLSTARTYLLHCLELGEAPEEFTSNYGVGSFRVYYLLAKVDEALEDDMGAIEAYINSVTLQAGFKKAFYPLVKLVLKREQNKIKANEVLEQHFSGPTIDTMAAIGDAWFNQGEYYLSLKWIGKVLSKQPDNKDMLLLQGQCWARMGQYQEAINNFSRLYSTNLKNEAFTEGCLCHWALGEHDKVDELLDMWQESKGNGVSYAYRLLQQAIVGEAPQLLPKDVLPGFYVLIQKILVMGIGNLEARVLSLLGAVPNERPSQRLGKILWLHGDWDMAAHELIGCMNEGKIDAQGCLVLGRICLRQKLYEEAEQLIHSALVMNAVYPDAYLSLAKLYLTQAEEALAQSKQVFVHNEILERYHKKVYEVFKQFASY